MTQQRRVEYIDGLRGIAVVAMFFVHAAVAWLSPVARNGSYFARSMALSGVVAPTFLFLAGLSMAVVAERERTTGADPRATRGRIVRRGLEIVAIGYGLHFTFFALSGFDGDWTRVFKVDVLHCIGLSMIAFARFAWPTRKTNWRAGAVFVIFPVLAWVAYRSHVDAWLPGGLASYLTTRGSLALFPFVPYAAWVALGLFVAPYWLAASADRRKESRFGLGLLAAGAFLFLGRKALGQMYYGFSLDELGLDRPGDAVQSKGILHLFWTKAAFVFLFFSVAIFTKAIWRGPLAGALLLLGRRSLFAYCAHLVVIYPVAGPHLSERLVPWEHAALSVLLTVFVYGLVLSWSKLDPTSLRRRRLSLPRALGGFPAVERASGENG